MSAWGEARRSAQGVGAVSAAVRQALDAIFGDLNATVQFATALAGETQGQTGRIREVVRRMEEVAGGAATAGAGGGETAGGAQQQNAPPRGAPPTPPPHPPPARPRTRATPPVHPETAGP